MSMFCKEFIFDGISCKEYDLVICSFDGGKSETATAGSNIEYTTFKAPNSNKWFATGSAYKEQLTFTFSICKFQCNSSCNQPLSERELSFLMRWLVRKDYKYLNFLQEGYENIHYNCQINAEKYEVGGKCYGLTLTVVCDAPFGWSEQMSTTISSSTSKTVTLYNNSDEIGVIYPDMVINSNAGTEQIPQEITICNALTGDEMKIKKCIKNERIAIYDRIIESTECYKTSENEDYKGNHPTFFKDFNYNWITIGNTFDNRVNEIIVTGNCNIELSWRVPRKAVI